MEIHKSCTQELDTPADKAQDMRRHEESEAKEERERERDTERVRE